MTDRSRESNTKLIEYMDKIDYENINIVNLSNNYLKLTALLNDLPDNEKIKIIDKIKNVIKINGLVYNLQNFDIKKILNNYLLIFNIFVSKDRVIPSEIPDDNIFTQIFKKYLKQLSEQNFNEISTDKIGQLKQITENYNILKKDIDLFININKKELTIDDNNEFNNKNRSLVNQIINNFNNINVIDEVTNEKLIKSIEKIGKSLEEFLNSELKIITSQSLFSILYIIFNNILQLYCYNSKKNDI